MTKYDIRPKSSSGLLHSSSHTPDSLRLTFRIAPYRSQKFHATRPGARPAVLKPRQRPHATRAAPEEPDDLAFYHRLHSYRDRGDAGHRLQGGPEDSGNGDWADESTLIAMLQDGDPLEDEDCGVAGLLDRLNDTMVAYRPGLKDHLKEILITTIHHQTRLHDTLRDEIDTSFATGILSVDQVCKNVESLRLKDEDDVTSFYSGVKVKMGQIQAQISTMEAERKRILEALEREATQRLNAIASVGEGMPAHMENLLSKLERKCKEQEKEAPDLEKSVAALLKLQMN